MGAPIAHDRISVTIDGRGVTVQRGRTIDAARAAGVAVPSSATSTASRRSGPAASAWSSCNPATTAASSTCTRSPPRRGWRSSPRPALRKLRR
ncbi:MAG: 2Fe-2S iron-sulfur cluster-binding protein [Thermomicrobiales bacterium]